MRAVAVCAILFAAVFMTWLLAVSVQTAYVVNDRAAIKSGMGIPRSVMLVPEREAQQLSAALDKIHDFCNACDAPVWVDAGTALGMERHGGRIPWDDDYDLGFLERDMQILYETARRMGTLKIAPFGFPNASHLKIYDASTGEDLCDLFPYRIVDDHIKLAWPCMTWDHNSPKYRHHLKDIQPLRWRKFDHTTLPSVANNKKYVTERYGTDSLRVASVQAPHNVTILEKGIFAVNPFISKSFSLKNTKQ